MLGVHRRKHRLLAEELVIVFLDLRVEARIVIRVERSRIAAACGGVAHNSFVQAPQPSRSRRPLPDVVSFAWVCVAPPHDTPPANLPARHHPAHTPPPL